MPGDRIIFGAAAIPEPDRDWLAAVERLPVESIWQGGHVLPPGPTGEAITRLALMTAWTERVRVGAAVLLLPLYPPVVVAKQLADLDSRSGGRLTVGVGVGGEFRHEFDAVGVPLAERGPRTDEAMWILRTLWGGGPASHHGAFFSFEDVELRPVCPPAEPGPRMRPGGPPLVVSGRRERAMRRAAHLGDGWLPYLVSPEAYARSVRTIEEEAGAAGRDLAGFEWMMYLYCSIRRDGDRARDDVARFLGSAYGDKPRDMLDRIAPAGTPDQVAARLQAYVDAGVRHFVISPAAHDDTLEVVRLAAEEVLPRLSVPASVG
ncbi:Flavin-dependent oxidoreductase, luciferase family (includes alkanesulfonate monooxygenase SsuD and methylene tetrahydromethanopterin reductase) [Thermomonospora echinospora]|uniref:Flavin-dependent oxidoreductase, luciferase family (Includes alkanesulfonate monooxygenase SsuD and methylene tetrahydromethanopterin reductase) n=1 Tax=Thermomonospora echinospora TaxID=1992 RepID=A0A1H6DGV5_9ACTN|nr:LLM class flavin-dependent oxidoreductase [Thermomonospora echinospora]SEG83875.1 Flavin-dependent oxidoreductase, luciferase family (includes alkanesulfonate monooxygenase SsuD and methylene tetrahydromethanopterin reductase) [Thermomonospora echinospora]